MVNLNGNCGSGAPRTLGEYNVTNYTFGPDGRVAQSLTYDPYHNTGGSALRSWHWNGKSLMYTSTGSSVDEVMVGPSGVIPAGGGNPGLTIADPDPNGFQASDHNGTGYGSWSAPNPLGQKCVSQNPVPAEPGFVDFASPMSLPTVGVLDDGTNTFRGRGYESLSAAVMHLTPNARSQYVASSSKRSTLEASSANCPATSSILPVIGCTNSTCGWECQLNQWEALVAMYTGLGYFSPDGGGIDGLPFPSRPALKPLEMDGVPRNPCASQIATAGFAAGFLIGVQGSVTFNQNDVYLNFGPEFGTVPGAGASLMVGTVYANPGQSVDDVLSGYSVTADAGALVGGAVSANPSGSTVSGGIVSPSAGVGYEKTFGPFQVPWNICGF